MKLYLAARRDRKEIQQAFHGGWPSFLDPAVGLILFLLASCSTPPPPPPSPPTGMIGGIQAAQSKVVLARQQDVTLSANIINLLPAGEYRAVYGNQNGIYYEAPSKIIERQAVAGLHPPDLPFTGGIFLERTNPQAAKIWEMSVIARDGKRPGRVFTPESSIQFHLTR